MEVNEDWVPQMRKCSFQMYKFGTAVQFVTQYYHPEPASQTNSRRHRGVGGAWRPWPFWETNMAHRTWQSSVSTTSVLRTPQRLHSAPTFLSVVYLSRTVVFVLFYFESLSELNLYSLYLFFFFLKLPKILHKGKLCSLFYALSDEAKYPLIVDQRRRKNLEAINEF